MTNIDHFVRSHAARVSTCSEESCPSTTANESPRRTEGERSHPPPAPSSTPPPSPVPLSALNEAPAPNASLQREKTHTSDAAEQTPSAPRQDEVTLTQDSQTTGDSAGQQTVNVQPDPPRHVQTRSQTQLRRSKQIRRPTVRTVYYKGASAHFGEVTLGEDLQVQVNPNQEPHPTDPRRVEQDNATQQWLQVNKAVVGSFAQQWLQANWDTVGSISTRCRAKLII